MAKCQHLCTSPGSRFQAFCVAPSACPRAQRRRGHAPPAACRGRTAEPTLVHASACEKNRCFFPDIDHLGLDHAVTQGKRGGGYGDFFPIATRSGVGTTQLYISCTYPESLRSLSGSTVYLSTGTGMRIFFQLYAFQCQIAPSRRPRSSLRPGAPMSRIPARSSRAIDHESAIDRASWAGSREQSQERSFHARRQHEVSSVRGQAMCEAAVTHLRRRTPSPTKDSLPCGGCSRAPHSFRRCFATVL